MFSLIDVIENGDKKLTQLLNEYHFVLNADQINEIKYHYLPARFQFLESKSINKKQLNDFKKLFIQEREYLISSYGKRKKKIPQSTLKIPTKIKIEFKKSRYEFTDTQLMGLFSKYLDMILSDLDSGEIKFTSTEHEFKQLINPLYNYLIALRDQGLIDCSINRVLHFLFDLMHIIFPDRFLFHPHSYDDDSKRYKASRIKRMI